MKTGNWLLLGTMLIAFTSTTVAQSWITNGLMVYYPFNGNANDESGSGHHGTFFGTPTLTANRHGVQNTAYSFNGTNTLIHAAGTPINDVTNNFTMTVWFRAKQPVPPETSRASLIYATHGAAVWGDSSVGAGIMAGTDKIAIWEHTHDYNPIVLSTPGNFNNWNMVCLVYSNKVPIIFVNGQQRVTGTASPRAAVRPSVGHIITPGPHPYGDQIAGIGGAWRNSQQAGNVFDGDIDDIRIYNRALLSSEVAQLYAIEAGPTLNIRKAIYLDSSNLWPGTNFQLQVSSDLNTWTNHGVPFTATNSNWRSTNYWDVDDWNQLSFRLQVVP